MPILTQKEAAEIVAAYNKNYLEAITLLEQENEAKLSKIQESKTALNQEKARASFRALSIFDRDHLEKAAQRLQKRWTQLSTTDSIIAMNPKGIHTSAFHRFLNQQHDAKKSLNKTKQATLLAALKNNDWNYTVFSDQYFVETAHALFASNQINYHVMETITSVYQIKATCDNPSQDIALYPILDSSGEFTQETKLLFFTALSNFIDESVSEDEKEDFKNLLKAFINNNPSENIFCAYKPSKTQLNDTLSKELIERNTIFSTGELLIELSSSAHDAFRLARFGLENTVQARIAYGKFDLPFMESCVDNGYRPVEGSHPNNHHSAPLHAHKDCSLPTRSSHDHYHADLMSRMGKSLRAIFKNAKNLTQREILFRIDAIREKKRLYSTEVWNMFDLEISNFNYTNMRYANAALVAAKFSEAIDLPVDFGDNYIFLKEDYIITDAGILFIIDLTKKHDEWLALGLNPELLVEHIGNYYALAKKIKSHFGNDPKLNILLFRIYLSLDQKNLFQVWVELVKRQYPLVKDEFIFARNNKIEFLGLVDTHLGKPISTKSCLLQLRFLDNEAAKNLHDSVSQIAYRNIGEKVLANIALLKIELSTNNKSQEVISAFSNFAVALLNRKNEAQSDFYEQGLIALVKIINTNKSLNTNTEKLEGIYTALKEIQETNEEHIPLKTYIAMNLFSPLPEQPQVVAKTSGMELKRI